MSRRPQLFAGLVLAGVFVLGALSGIAGGAVLAHRHLRSITEGTPEEVDIHVTLALLDRALRLSDDEHRGVRAVLEKNEPEHTRLRETIEPALTALRAKEREEIRALLDPDQQSRLDAILQHLDQRRGRVGRLLDH